MSLLTWAHAGTVSRMQAHLFERSGMSGTSFFNRPRALVLTGAVLTALVLPVLPASAASAPTIAGVAPSPTHVGRTVTISGSGLTGTTAVALGGAAMPFAFVTDGKLTATVPVGAGTAPVTVTTGLGSVTSSVALQVAAAPAAVTGLIGTVGDRVVNLTWTGGGTGGAIVREVTGAPAPVTPASGRPISSSRNSAHDLAFANRTSATYAVWAVETDGATSELAATVTVAPIAPVATALPVTASAGRVAFGSRLVLTGRLSRGAAHTPMAKAPVDVYVRPGGRATASRVAQVLSGLDGSVSFVILPRVSAAYQLRYRGDAFSTPTASGQPAVAVQPRVSAGLFPSAIVRGQTTHLRGTLVPNYGGVRAQIQRRAADGTWRAISTVGVSGSGNYDATFTPGVGSYVLRVVLPASASSLSASSGAVVLAVGQRQLGSGSHGDDVIVLERRLAGLHYDVGRQDGVFDYDLQHAVIAFQKIERLSRTGTWGNAERARIDRPTPFQLRFPTAGRAFEVDITRQVLVMSMDGDVQRILDVSTGSNNLYTVDGVTDRATTPRGHFRILSKIDGIQNGRLGELYRPSYFFQGWAIHGNGSVPTYPASHGCVRITNPAADRLFALLTIGSPVSLYDE